MKCRSGSTTVQQTPCSPTLPTFRIDCTRNPLTPSISRRSVELARGSSGFQKLRQNIPLSFSEFRPDHPVHRTVATFNESDAPGGRDDPGTKVLRTGPRQSWLAGYLPHVFLRRLLRSGAHGFRPAARDQRGPGRAGEGVRHPWPPGYGDPHGGARRRPAAPGQPWQRLGDPPGRRAAHERGHRRAAQRIQRVGQGARTFPSDLDRAEQARGRGPATSRSTSAPKSVGDGSGCWRRPPDATSR